MKYKTADQLPGPTGITQLIIRNALLMANERLLKYGGDERLLYKRDFAAFVLAFRPESLHRTKPEHINYNEFERNILAWGWLGNVLSERIDYDYLGNARAKTWTSFRTGAANREILEEHPYMLDALDSLWIGSVRIEELVVGVSGLEEAQDEGLSASIANDLYWQIRHGSVPNHRINKTITALRERDFDTKDGGKFNRAPDWSGWGSADCHT